MSDNKDLTTLNHDQQLREQIERGEITQAQVDTIWKATWDMSAQTPITVRRAVAAMREVSAGKTPEQAMALMFPLLADFMMTAATETQAALTRDESKFAHLVAGTEAIVKTLQNINPLERRLERLEAATDAIGIMVGEIKARLALMEPEPNPIASADESIPETQECDHDYPARDGKCLGCGAAVVGETLPDPEQEANEARRKTIGSAWAPDPDQVPLYKYRCPKPDCDYIYEGYLAPDRHQTYYCLTHINVKLVPA